MAKDSFWQAHRINPPQEPMTIVKAPKPGVVQRQNEEAAATDLYTRASTTKNLQNVGRASAATIRVERAAADEPSVPGSDSPSVIRQRAARKPK